MSDAPRSRIKVVSGPEILLLITLFVVILYLLYPKSFLEKGLLSEKSNYDLAFFYLENLLPADPHNEALMLKLAEAAFRSNRMDMARKMVSALIASKNPQTQRMAYPLWYEIEKRRYFTTTDARLRKKIKEELTGILEMMQERDMIDAGHVSRWFAEALWLKNDRLALSIALTALEKNPYDTAWLKTGYYLAVGLEEFETAKTLLLRLLKADRAREDRWRDALASIYLKEKRALDAANLYLQAYRRRSQAAYLFKAIDILAWNHRYKEALRMARRYERQMIADRRYAQKLLRFYLASNALEDAHRIALHLVKMCEKRSISSGCDFDLLFKTFLYTKDPLHAYKTAEIVLRGKRSYAWQMRAAKSALWSQMTQKAMKHYLRAYAMHPTAGLRKKLLPLMIDAYQYESALKLAKDEAKTDPSKKNIDTVVYLYNMVGDPGGAIDFLLEMYEKTKKPALLSRILQLALDSGDMQRAGKVARRLNALGVDDFTTARRIAYYEFLNRRPESAYVIVKKALKHKDRSAPVDFLQLAGDLAWYLGKYDEASEYALELMGDKAARTVDLRRILDVYRRKDPLLASKAAWRIYKTDRLPENFITYAYIALDGHLYEELSRHMENIEKHQESVLLQDPRYWSVKAYLLIALHLKKEASRALKMAMLLDPGNHAMEAQMLWLLVDAGDCVQLHAFVSKLEKDGLRLPEILWAPLLAAHMKLQEGDMAMAYLGKISKAAELSIEMKLTYAYLLQGRNEHEAFMRQMREVACSLGRILSKDPEKLHERKFLQNYLQAAIYTMNPDRFEALLESVKDDLDRQRYLQIRALWDMHNNAYEAAREALHRLHNPEMWMRLALALHFYERDKMSTLLDGDLCALPVRDRVDAAERSGRIALAQSLAFWGMETNRNDELLYYQNEQLERKWADEWHFYVSTDSRSSMQQIVSNMTNKNAIGEGWYLKESLKARHNSGWDDSVYRYLPQNDNTYEAQILHKSDRVQISLAAGIRNGVKNHLQLTGSVIYQIDDRWRSRLSLLHNQEALESDYLAVGGMKKGVELECKYVLLPSTTIQMRAGKYRFLSQDGVSLGSGMVLRAESYTSLRIGYPDLAVTLFANHGAFSEKNSQKGVLDKIMAVHGNVLPDDYFNLGAGVYWGYQNKVTHVRPWRPFFGISPSVDLVGGNMNLEMDAGIGGNIFHQGHLAIGTGVTPGVSGNSESVFKVYLQYSMLY